MLDQVPSMPSVLRERRARELARPLFVCRKRTSPGPEAAEASARTTRARISPAALRVNVIASTRSGRSTTASSASRRWIRSSVLPEPAGA